MAYPDLDRRIIDILLDDGRVSLRSIADELDVAVTTVSNHLGTLEDDAVIEAYVPKLDYEQLGYRITAIIQLRVRSGHLPEVTEALVDHDQLLSIYEVTGYYDVLAVGKFVDTSQMNAQIKSLLEMPEVLESNSNIALATPTEFRQFPLDAGPS
ncbi:MAG: HTH-type transcriptional regulator Lrp [Haloferacaceae archaeon]